MEEYLKLLEKGNMGMETALIDLGLQQVTRRRVSYLTSLGQRWRLTTEYSRAKKVALGASILEVGLIENLSLERMMFLELLASLLYKTHSVWKLAIVMLGALYRFRFITSRTCVRTFEIFTEM